MEADERLWIIPTDLRSKNKASTGLVIINLFVMNTCTVHAFVSLHVAQLGKFHQRQLTALRAIQVIMMHNVHRFRLSETSDPVRHSISTSSPLLMRQRFVYEGTSPLNEDDCET